MLTIWVFLLFYAVFCLMFLKLGMLLFIYLSYLLGEHFVFWVEFLYLCIANAFSCVACPLLTSVLSTEKLNVGASVHDCICYFFSIYRNVILIWK